MKIILFFASIFFAIAAAAEDPFELKVRVSAYESEKKRVLAPVELKYDRDLIDLKSRYTKAGRLDDALAVDRIIKSRKKEEPDSKKSESLASKITRSDSDWIWQSGGELHIDRNGTARHTNWRLAAAWEQDGDKLIISRSTGTKFIVEFQDEKNATATAEGGAVASLVRK